MEIHGFVGEHSTQWFQYGAMGDTRFRMCAYRRSKAIDDEINLAKVLFDEIDGFVFDLIGECITINALSIEAGFLGFLLKGGTVVPSGDAVLPSCAGFSKNTPMVAAPLPKAAVMRELRPKPVDAPITSTRLGPSMAPFDLM